jgi:hypothetical protein
MRLDNGSGNGMAYAEGEDLETMELIDELKRLEERERLLR